MFPAKSIMNKDVVSVTCDTDIYEAISTLINYNITGLPVIHDDGTLAGILSEKDVLRLLVNNEDRPQTVREFMTCDVVTYDEEDSLVEIAERFIESTFRRVPILKDGKLAGIISRRDIVRFILKLRHKDPMHTLC